MNGRQLALISGLFGTLLASGSLASIPPQATSTINAPSESTRGSLVIQAIQGTPGGPAIKNIGVEISLVFKKAPPQTIHAQLDEYGIVYLNDIPIDADVRPVIRIDYAGVTYQEAGEIMGRANREQSIEVKCYEVTSDIPLWTMPVRQVMLSHAPQGIKVTEILVIKNPSERTWLGTQNHSDRPVTMSVRLPQGAEQIKLGTGFHQWCCTSIESGMLVNHLPMMPDITEMNFSYIINTTDGTFDLNIIAPADIEQMVVMVPDDMHAHSTDGLTLGKTELIADTTVRYYTVTDSSKGDTAQLELSGLPKIRAVADSTNTPVTINPKMLFIVACGVIVFLAGSVIVYQIKRKAKA